MSIPKDRSRTSRNSTDVAVEVVLPVALVLEDTEVPLAKVDELDVDVPVGLMLPVALAPKDTKMPSTNWMLTSPSK